MVRSSASTARRSKRFVNPRTCRAESSGFMMSGLSRFAAGANHGPKIFRRGESKAANPVNAHRLPGLAAAASGSALFLKYLLPHVAKNCRLTGRQIGEADRLTELSHGSGSLQIGQRLVDRDQKVRVAGEADIAAIGANRVIVSGAREFCVRMGGAVSIEPAQIEKRCVEVAAVERTEQIVAAGNQMRDVVDQPPVVEPHQDRVGQRSAFDADAKSGEVTDTRDTAVARLGAKRDRQGRIDIGLARHEYAERHATPAIVACGALEIGQLGGLHAGNNKRILRQGVAADERAAAVREEGVGFEGWTGILVELAFEPLVLE